MLHLFNLQYSTNLQNNRLLLLMMVIMMVVVVMMMMMMIRKQRNNSTMWIIDVSQLNMGNMVLKLPPFVDIL